MVDVDTEAIDALEGLNISAGFETCTSARLGKLGSCRLPGHSFHNIVALNGARRMSAAERKNLWCLFDYFDHFA